MLVLHARLFYYNADDWQTSFFPTDFDRFSSNAGTDFIGLESKLVE
jgi:hypothetical protein